MLAYRATDSLADISTNVSLEAVAAFEQKGASPVGRLVAVANGIDTDRFFSDGRVRELTRTSEKVCLDEKIIVAVGRLAEAKDYPNLLRAFAQMDKQGKTVRLWIAGGGDLLVGLLSLSEELGISKDVSFLGMRSDIPALLNAADVYVLSSAWEGLPLVVGESMACEKVVVATNCGGVREVLGDCGFLVPAGDPGLLAAGLSQALKLDRAQALALGVRARARVVDHYSLKIAVAKWNEIYKTSDPGKFVGI